jgi:hypothetical protein
MSNIYLNEFDRFIKYELKPLAYMRYGDDWLCFMPSEIAARQLRCSAAQKLDQLSLCINPKIDSTKQARKGIAYLGADIWPTGRRLQPTVSGRVQERLSAHNAASYRALVASHQKSKRLKELNWLLADQLD